MAHLATIKAVTPAGSHSPLPPAADRRAAAGVGSTAHTFDFPLPAWAQSLEAKLLLSNIQADPPEYVQHGTEEAAAHGVGRYRGRYVRQLRKLFEPAERSMMDYCDAAKDRPEVEQERRRAFVAWVASHGPDALIDRVIDEHGDGYARKAVAK